MDIDNEIIGYIGNTLLCICALPQIITIFRTKNSQNLSWMFLFCWFIGEIISLEYILNKSKLIIPIFINYILNIIFIITLIFLKYKYDRRI